MVNADADATLWRLLSFALKYITSALPVGSESEKSALMLQTGSNTCRVHL